MTTKEQIEFLTREVLKLKASQQKKPEPLTMGKVLSDFSAKFGIITGNKDQLEVNGNPLTPQTIDQMNRFLQPYLVEYIPGYGSPVSAPSLLDSVLNALVYQNSKK